MLHQPLITLFCMIAPLVSAAQVVLTKGITFTGEDGARTVEGMAFPADATAALSVTAYATGTAHWAIASQSGAGLSLAMTPPLVELTDGVIVRFVSPTNLQEDATISAGGQTRPLRMPDGTALPQGAVLAGGVHGSIFVQGTWYLMAPSTNACPPGSIRTVFPVCMDIESVPGKRFYEAVDHCAAKGGKLCSWDEYAVGCSLQQPALSGLFNEWEWIDDCSNHTHSANQAGRFTCQSQRSANVITTMTGDTRCCYHTR